MHCSALSDSSPVVSLEKGEKREGSRETTGDESAALWLAVKILRHFPRQWDLNLLKLLFIMTCKLVFPRLNRQLPTFALKSGWSVLFSGYTYCVRATLCREFIWLDNCSVWRICISECFKYCKSQLYIKEYYGRPILPESRENACWKVLSLLLIGSKSSVRFSDQSKSVARPKKVDMENTPYL